MAEFYELWRDAKRCPIEKFRPFAIVEGKLWAPAYIKDRWRVLELDLSVALDGASQVFCLAGDQKNLVSFVHEAMKRRQPRVRAT